MAYHKNLWKRMKRKLQKRGPVYIHQYKGGYDEYVAVQIEINRRKLHKVWADSGTMESIAQHIESIGPVEAGICHGARNGFEVEWFRERLQADVIGTDIADTATDFPNMAVWDFHDVNPAWIAKFYFVYTNSLDQAMDPMKALLTWIDQLKSDGRIYIEHTKGHEPDRASEKDPFGAKIEVMPQLLNEWGEDRFELDTTLKPGAKSNNGLEAFLFVLKAK